MGGCYLRLPSSPFLTFRLTLLLTSLAGLVRSQGTIADAIKSRPELSQLAAYMRLTTLLTQLGQSGRSYTFFAPNNDAFLNVSEQTRALFRSAISLAQPATTVNGILTYHAAESKIYTSAAATNDVAISTMADGSPKLFLVTSYGEKFINGARFVVPDLDVSGNVTNGVLHIIDRVFIEPKYSANAFSLMSSATLPTGEYMKMLNFYYDSAVRGAIQPTRGLNAKDSLLNKDNMFQTVFVPTDTAMRNLMQLETGFRYRSIMSGGDYPLLQRIIESHIVPYKPYHSNILETMSLGGRSAEAVQGKVGAYRLNGALFANNDCVHAGVTVANITVTNAAVFLIDNVFGFVYFDMYWQLHQDPAMLNELYGVVLSAPTEVRDLMHVAANVTGDVPDSQKNTLFAPIVTAFSYNDFSYDPTIKGQQLLQHMLPGMVSIFQMTNGTVLPTLRPEYSIRFYQFGDVRYAEVDYVRAKIVQAGVCVRNGVIHKIDAILGVPGRTVYEEVYNNPILSDLRDVLIQVQLYNILSDMQSQYTLFAPVSFVQMRRTDFGVSLLDKRLMASRLKNLMLRHITTGYLFLDTLPATGSVTTNYDAIAVTRDSNGEYYILIGTLRIHVSRPNMRMKNGVIHIIDQVIFDATDPTTGQSITSAAATTSSQPYSILCTILLSVFAVARRLSSAGCAAGPRAARPPVSVVRC